MKLYCFNFSRIYPRIVIVFFGFFWILNFEHVFDWMKNLADQLIEKCSLKIMIYFYLVQIFEWRFIEPV